jgi:hypothetical protein
MGRHTRGCAGRLPLGRSDAVECGLSTVAPLSLPLRSIETHVTMAETEPRWPFDDPTQAEGSTAERLHAFRTGRGQNERRLRTWLKILEDV